MATRKKIPVFDVAKAQYQNATDERAANLRCLAYQRAIEYMMATCKPENAPDIDSVLQNAEKIANFLTTGVVKPAAVTTH